MSIPVRVPTRPLAVTTASLPTPVAPATTAVHATVVFDVHAAVLHVWAARLAVRVLSVVRKARPESVAMPPSVTAMFSGKVKLTTGAWANGGGA